MEVASVVPEERLRPPVTVPPEQRVPLLEEAAAEAALDFSEEALVAVEPEPR